MKWEEERIPRTTKKMCRNFTRRDKINVKKLKCDKAMEKEKIQKIMKNKRNHIIKWPQDRMQRRTTKKYV